jgi:hypothetical protein
LLRRFCAERKGNVAIIFALALIPTIFLIGMAWTFPAPSRDARNSMLPYRMTLLQRAGDASERVTELWPAALRDLVHRDQIHAICCGAVV